MISCCVSRLMPNVLPNVSGAPLPSLAKEGWTRHKENVAKPPLKERTGWFVQQPIIGGLNQPPRLRQLRNGAVLFMAQPPLLIQGGEFMRPQKSFVHRIDNRFALKLSPGMSSSR